MSQPLFDIFERIYRTDLVYVPSCWKLCGDAHCCSFKRYKQKFQVMAQQAFNELYLLPGEYDFLKAKGWLGQFGDFDHGVVEYPIDGGVVRVESLVSRRPGCACDHDTRTTICRLYPLLPVYDLDGRLVGTETVGLYEELEALDALEPACKLTNLPFDQASKFLEITSAIGGHPLLRFYASAYRIAKRHVRLRLRALKDAEPDQSAFTLFEGSFLMGSLFDHAALKAELSALARSFQGLPGGALALGG